MLTWLIPLIVCLIIFAVFLNQAQHIYCESFDYFLMGFLSLCCGGLTFLITFHIGHISIHQVGTSSKKVEIYSIESFSSVNTIFTLGVGYIDGTKKYSVYYRDETSKGYKWMGIPAESATIFMDSDEKPYIIENRKEFKGDPLWNSEEFSFFDNYEIHVPANTIVKNLEIK